MFDEIFQDNNIKENNICGIVTGLVKEIYDSKHPGMVKVEMFMTGEETLNITDWIRVIVPYGGKEKGMYFLPDIGDEVAIAFERGDIEKPYVLGCLWNNTDTIPANTVKEDNSIKKLKTKGGHEIIFDDTKDKGKLEIITPKKSKIVMDDENSLITISAAGDKGKNILKLDSKKGTVTVTGKEKIVLDAGGTKITIDGIGKKIDIEGNNINLKGMNIKEEGQAISIKGTKAEVSATAELNLKCDGIANIKGAMVKIN